MVIHLVLLFQNLKYNLFKNVASFLWQTQIQTIEYGLNDTIRIKRKKFDWYFIHLKTMKMPKVLLAKKMSQKS